MEQIVQQALSEAEKPKPKRPRLPKEEQERRRKLQRGRGKGNGKNRSPTERTQAARKAAMAVKGKRGGRPGVPHGWTAERYVVALDDARKKAREIFNYMADLKLLPDDELAQAAMLEALTIMKNKATTPNLKLQAAKTLLEYTKQKPASTSNVNLNAAENFLEALAKAEDETNT